MDVHRPDTLSEALELRAAQPDARPLAGGTDLMVDLNFDRARPPAILDLTGVPELREWAPDDGRVRVGAGVTYTRIMAELGDRLPGLAVASRTVGSLQIRNRGTVGGNLATASPAGDGLPPLYTADAVVELASTRGTRSVPVAELITGPKRTALADDELIVAFTLPAADRPAGVRQGRDAQRDGDLRLRRQPRAVAARSAASRPASARPGRRRSPPPPRTRSSPPSSTGTGSARPRTPRSPASARSPGRPRGRSTTSAAPRTTAATRSACSRAGR